MGLVSIMAAGLAVKECEHSKGQHGPAGHQGPSEQAVIPAQAGIQGYCKVLKSLDDVLLLLHTLRAIRYANVRFGVPPPQSGLRRNDEQELDQNFPKPVRHAAAAVAGVRVPAIH